MTATAQAPRRGSMQGERRAEVFAGYAFIAVPLVLFLVLNIGAILFALFISFFDYAFRGGAGDPVGLANYEALLGDRVFHKAIYNTVTYTIVVVPLQMALGLLLAVIVNAKIRGQT